MKNQKILFLAAFLLGAVAFQTALSQTANDGKLANMTGGGSSVRWDVLVANAGASLIIAAPDGRSFRRDFKAGTTPEISLSDRQLESLGDGTYSYELRLRPVLSAAAKEAILKARGSDDDPEAERAGRKRPAVPQLVQAGSFSILNGSIFVPGAVEGQRNSAKKTEQPRIQDITFGSSFARLRNHPLGRGARPDDVIADDLIVQGSACVGLDCVSGEVFGFDTIRLKENNTRLQFDDTSTSAGFPTNNWQIRANDSASGGGSFLGIVDQGATGNSETGTIIGRFDAGAPANSLRITSSGKLGLRTATPVLDVHMNTSDTPAIRLEQNNSGGFTGQTWDVAGNEANFFVRDVTGGSRLPLRIRPGAPTSSIDINASGNVGVGTASPGTLNGVTFSTVGLHVKGTGGSKYIAVDDSTTVGFLLNDSSQAADSRMWALLNQGSRLSISTFTDAGIPTERFSVLRNGRVGIGTSVPDQLLSVNGDASKTGGNTWLAFSDERLKNIKGKFNSGLKAVMQLQPIRYEYLENNALGLKSDGEHIGFGAQAVQKIIPEAVTKNSTGYLMVNGDPILWTMLNAIKEQQQEIVALKKEVRRLRASSRTRRR